MEIKDLNINEKITVPKVRLIDQEGKQLGIVDTDKALKLAQEAELDLVEIVITAEPPVAKILNYSKYKYNLAHKTRMAKKRQTNTEIKEVRFRLKIEENDYNIKVKKVEKFLSQGDKVKVGIMFKGREQAHPERGAQMLNRVAELIGSLATVEQKPSQEGRNMSLVLAPTQKKVATISEQRRRGGEKKLNRMERIEKRLKKAKVEGEKDAKE